jgi:hypothetical protein
LLALLVAALAASFGVAAPALAWTPPSVRYEIDVRLDPIRNRLEGWTTIHYRSGADSALTALWLHAYPNAFSSHRSVYAREGERGDADYEIRFAPPRDRGWMTLDSATVNGAAAALTLSETLARVDLPSGAALEPGDSVTLRIRFEVQVPRPFDRFGHQGDDYSCAQWYPKMVVHDEDGWALDPYHYVAEFYGEFATYDVSITLPDGHWVGATGVMAGAEGGSNEIPLMRAVPDSVTVSLRAVPGADVPWPRESLRVLSPGEEPFVVEREGGVSWRVPRGAPTHYHYEGTDAPESTRVERDEAGRPRPWRAFTAWRDTTIIDTLRALVAAPAPADSALPSLKTLRYHAERVHDFAWVSSPRYVRADTTWNGIDVRALVFRDDADRWRGVLEYTVASLERFTAWVGPYRYPQVTTAESWMGGSAMEYPMLTMNDPDLTNWAFDALEPTIAHETGHNWFYGMIASDERRYAWIDEGFTQDLETRYTRERFPRGTWPHRDKFPWVAPLHHNDMAERSLLQRYYARDEQPPSTPANETASYVIYAPTAYDRPVAMLRTLRGTWGDSLADAFVRRVYRDGLFRHVRPRDIEAAARETLGEAGVAFLRRWIETNDVADFSLGGVRRERSDQGWRSTVTVRRKGGLSYAVPVEARFADGTRETRRVEVPDGEATVVFSSPSRLNAAVIDPRSEVYDVNRLNHRAGLLPPMRWRPIADVATPAAVSVLYGPTVWHGEAEGMRLGGWFEGRFLPGADFPRGVRSFEGGLNVGTRDGSVAWRAGAARRVGRLGARGSVRALAVRDAGLTRGELTLSNWIAGRGRRYPWWTWELKGRYLDRDHLPGGQPANVEPRVDPSYWSAGRRIAGSASIRLDTVGPRRRESVVVEGAYGVDPDRGGGAGSRFTRGSVEVRQRLDLGPTARAHADLRVYAGAVDRDAPREFQFDAVEASRLETLDRFYANDLGPLRETERYWTEGGGGLRGYVGRPFLGSRVASASLDLRHERWPVSIFIDGGRLDPSAGSAAISLADAGIGWDLGYVRLYAPVWVSNPPPGERPWETRWVFALALPDLRWR